MHGAKTSGKPSPAVKHGLQSMFVRKDNLPAIIAAEKQITDLGPDAVIKTQLAARIAGLPDIADLISGDVDLGLRVDAANRADVDSLAKAAALKLAAETPQAGNVTYMVGLNGGPTIVRGPQGTPVEALTDPDGRYLLQTEPGVWRRAEAFECAPGIEAFRVTINAVLADGE